MHEQLALLSSGGYHREARALMKRNKARIRRRGNAAQACAATFHGSSDYLLIQQTANASRSIAGMYTHEMNISFVRVGLRYERDHKANKGIIVRSRKVGCASAA
jgi:hypothetical protein